MNGFNTVARIEVRFRDTDAMGHVNNAVYLSYFEYARMDYVRDVFGITSFSDVDFIVARAEVDYKSPSFAGETLEVGVRVGEIGGASFKMEYRIEEKKTRRLVTLGKTVQVGYDYKAGRVKKITEEFIKKVQEHDNAA